jgi:hypothetical protein
MWRSPRRHSTEEAGNDRGGKGVSNCKAMKGNENVNSGK